MVILAVKIFADGGSCVVGGIEDGRDFDDAGSAKRGKGFLEGLQDFKGQGLICMLVIREEVHNDSVRECVDDVQDTRKIGVSVVYVPCRGLVMFGLGVVDLGNALGARRIKYTRWFYFGMIEDISCIFSQFHLGF